MTGYATLADIADIQAIRQRLAQHSRGVDRADEALLADCYHPDGTVDYRFYNGPAAPFAAMLTGAQRAQPVTQHRTSQMWIELDGPRARSESYIIAYAQSSDEDGSPMQRLICGRYLDRHEKRDGAWRLSHRIYLMDANRNWPGSFSIPGLAPLDQHGPAGGQGRADPGLALLAQAAAKNRTVPRGVPAMTAQTIDPDVADAVISRQQIADLTMAYCRGVDRTDEALLKRVFHADSSVVSGVFNGGGQAFATEICRIVSSGFTKTFHSIANQWIDITGDTAVGETYVIAAATFAQADDGLTELLTGGRYIDRFERRDGEWKIADRSFVQDWARTDPPTDSSGGMYAALDLHGARGAADPVYTLWAGQPA